MFTSGALAQDRITTKDGRTQDGKILGVSNATVQVQFGTNSVGVPVAAIASVTMAVPPEFPAGLTAFEAKDYAKALPLVKSVADRFKGLPGVAWAQQSTSLLGDIYVALNRLPEAEAAYVDFQKIYGQGSAEAEVGLSRIAIAKGDFATAQQKLTAVTSEALKTKVPPADKASAYSQAFYLLGLALESQKDYPAALENYLLTLTLFYHDRASATDAQTKADALRKTGVVVP